MAKATRSEQVVAGADGYRKRWVVAVEEPGGGTRIELAASFSALLERSDFAVIVIDVPIGLMDSGFRACDVAARRMVGQRRSSVFPAPIRPMLQAVDYEDACRRRFDVEGKECSRQLFAILPIVRDVDAQMTPEMQASIREGHPEVSFATLSGGAPLRYPKKSLEGKEERLSLLSPVFPDIEEQLARFGRPGAVTDVLDAYAMLWTARRVRDGEALTVSERLEYDPRGLRAEIVA